MADEVTVLKPGNQTSEHSAMQNASWWAKGMMIIGVLSTVVPQIVTMIQGTGIENTKTGATILSILGIVMAVVGAIKNASVVNTYGDGRSLQKAALLRDVPPPPAV